MTAPQEQSGRLKALEAYIAWRTLKHQEDQESVAAALALNMYPLWMIQRFTELDASTPMWVSAVLPLVKTAYLQSQRLAAVFASDVRFAAQPLDEPVPMVVPDVEIPDNVDPIRFAKTFIPDNVVDLSEYREPLVFDDFPLSDVAESLIINGNYEIKAAMPGREEDLMYSGLSNSSGAAIRQAMNGGRNVSGNVVYFDRTIIGYARVTDGTPCWFCALLASRGAVFKKASFNTGNRTNPWSGALTKSDKDFVAPKDGPDLPKDFVTAKVHNHCRCQLRPVYANERTFGGDLDPMRDEEAQFYFDQWERVSRDWYWLSNKQQAQKFREQYTPFRRQAPDIADVREELLDRQQQLSDPTALQSDWARVQISALA